MTTSTNNNETSARAPLLPSDTAPPTAYQTISPQTAEAIAENERCYHLATTTISCYAFIGCVGTLTGILGTVSSCDSETPQCHSFRALMFTSVGLLSAPLCLMQAYNCCVTTKKLFFPSDDH